MDTKRKCSKCHKYKTLDMFVKNKSQPLGVAYLCYECRRTLDKERYNRDPDKRRQVVYASRQKVVERNKELLWQHLQDKQCVDCGLIDPIVMEFDHTQDDKEYNVGAMIGNSYSWDTILKEVEKCDLVCANCHRRRTAKRGGWWRSLFTNTSNATS